MVATVLVQRAVWPFVQPMPTLLLVLGILVSGLHGEWAPGLLATALGTVAVDVWFLPGAGEALSGREALTLSLFACAGTLVTWINVQRRRGLRSATESEAWLRTTLRSIGDAVIATDRDGRVRFLNAVAERLTGWRSAAAAGRSLHEVFRLVDGEGRLVSRDGSEYLIDDSRAPIRDEDGALTGVVLVFRDSSERVREERRRAVVAEATEVLIGSLEYETTLSTVTRLLVPRAADRMSVHMVAEGGALALLVAAGEEETAATGVSPELEPVLLQRVAESQRAELRPRKMAVPLTARGRTLGVMIFARTSARAPFGARDREMAEELARRAADAVDNARLYREAHKAIRVRDDFLAIASHELRTPLTTLQLQLDSLERSVDRLPAETAALLRRKLISSSRQAVRLANLIDSLLDVSRITTGRLALRPEPMDLVEVAGEIAERFRPQAGAAGCELRLAAGESHIEVHWDRLRIEQVLSNLIANAIKYGAGGPVDIRVERSGDGVRIVIRDHGIGIGKDDVDRIFGRFERAVSARNYGGLGLGLFIARQIVEAHGGAIRVGAGSGPGAELVVVMPPETDAAPAAPPAEASYRQSGRAVGSSGSSAATMSRR